MTSTPTPNNEACTCDDTGMPDLGCRYPHRPDTLTEMLRAISRGALVAEPTVREACKRAVERFTRSERATINAAQGPDVQARPMCDGAVEAPAAAPYDKNDALEALQNARDAARQLAEEGHPRRGAMIENAALLADKEILRLERELSAMTERMNDWRATCSKMSLESARSAITPHPDTARLDWLEKWHQLRKDVKGYGDPGLALIDRTSDGWLLDSDIGGGEFSTLREAIDAGCRYVLDGNQK